MCILQDWNRNYDKATLSELQQWSYLQIEPGFVSMQFRECFQSLIPDFLAPLSFALSDMLC